MKPIKQINNVYGYCRVSTQEQAQNGISLETQKDLIANFIKEKYNREVDEWFIDDGVSGTVPILERNHQTHPCLLYTSPSPRDGLLSRMPSSA